MKLLNFVVAALTAAEQVNAISLGSYYDSSRYKVGKIYARDESHVSSDSSDEIGDTDDQFGTEKDPLVGHNDGSQADHASHEEEYSSDDDSKVGQAEEETITQKEDSFVGEGTAAGEDESTSEDSTPTDDLEKIKDWVQGYDLINHHHVGFEPLDLFESIGANGFGEQVDLSEATVFTEDDEFYPSISGNNADEMYANFIKGCRDMILAKSSKFDYLLSNAGLSTEEFEGRVSANAEALIHEGPPLCSEIDNEFQGICKVDGTYDSLEYHGPDRTWRFSGRVFIATPLIIVAWGTSVLMVNAFCHPLSWLNNPDWGTAARNIASFGACAIAFASRPFLRIASEVAFANSIGQFTGHSPSDIVRRIATGSTILGVHNRIKSFAAVSAQNEVVPIAGMNDNFNLRYFFEIHSPRIAGVNTARNTSTAYYFNNDRGELGISVLNALRFNRDYNKYTPPLPVITNLEETAVKLILNMDHATFNDIADRFPSVSRFTELLEKANDLVLKAYEHASIDGFSSLHTATSISDKVAWFSHKYDVVKESSSEEFIDFVFDRAYKKFKGLHKKRGKKKFKRLTAFFSEIGLGSKYLGLSAADFGGEDEDLSEEITEEYFYPLEEIADEDEDEDVDHHILAKRDQRIDEAWGEIKNRVKRRVKVLVSPWEMPEEFGDFYKLLDIRFFGFINYKILVCAPGHREDCEHGIQIAEK